MQHTCALITSIIPLTLWPASVHWCCGRPRRSPGAGFSSLLLTRLTTQCAHKLGTASTAASFCCYPFAVIEQRFIEDDCAIQQHLMLGCAVRSDHDLDVKPVTLLAGLFLPIFPDMVHKPGKHEIPQQDNQPHRLTSSKRTPKMGHFPLDLALHATSATIALCFIAFLKLSCLRTAAPATTCRQHMQQQATIMKPPLTNGIPIPRQQPRAEVKTPRQVSLGSCLANHTVFIQKNRAVLWAGCRKKSGENQTASYTLDYGQ